MILQDIKKHFIDLHDNVVNQKYNKTLPYSFHLEMVEAQANKFMYIINDNKDIDQQYERLSILACCYTHDSIEDARITYNDINQICGQDVAEITYLCTEDKGRNRAERKSNRWYNELKTNKLAVFVKLCDIIANVKFSLLTNSSMFDKYKQEYNQKVKSHLYLEQYKPMFDYLDKLFEL